MRINIKNALQLVSANILLMLVKTPKETLELLTEYVTLHDKVAFIQKDRVI